MSALQKKPTASRKPATQPLPGKSAPAAAIKPPVAPSTTVASTSAHRAPPAPPRAAAPPPPPPPPEPEVEMYKAKYAFEGQEGEMSLKKDDLVEVVEKEDNGWWLVKKDGIEGWAPNNYLELVPPKPKAQAPPPPPPPPPPGPSVHQPAAASAGASIPAAPKPPVAKVVAKSLAADASAKPVSVFPGMGPANGSATPWKKSVVSTATNGSSHEVTPTSSRPTSSLGHKPPPPPVASKPKPTPPPVGGKPGAPKVGGKPPVPNASRPPVVPAAPRSGAVAKPAAVAGQLDLAAVVSRL